MKFDVKIESFSSSFSCNIISHEQSDYAKMNENWIYSSVNCMRNQFSSSHIHPTAEEHFSIGNWAKRAQIKRTIECDWQLATRKDENKEFLLQWFFSALSSSEKLEISHFNFPCFFSCFHFHCFLFPPTRRFPTIIKAKRNKKDDYEYLMSGWSECSGYLSGSGKSQKTLLRISIDFPLVLWCISQSFISLLLHS